MDEKALMTKSIEISRMSQAEDKGTHPYVGAVLTDIDGNIIETSFRGEGGEGCHCEYSLFKKLEGKEIDYKNTVLFVTLEPCTSRGPGKTPCSKIIAEMGVPKVYIGMLDPNPKICGKGESFLRSVACVERYPSDLVKEIGVINENFIEMYKNELIPDTSLFATQQISEIIKEQLKRKGITIDISIDNWDFTLRDIINYCSYSKQNYCEDIGEIIESARNFAYNKKYSSYKYDENDIRGMNREWPNEILNIFKLLNIAENYDSYNIIDVGEGNGLEAKELFKNSQHLTLINISDESLKLAKSYLPMASSYLNSAENLKNVSTCSQDIYVSFRTYQSSFFDINKAIEEAYRVLKPEGSIVISIANGFVGESNVIVHGLVIPGTRIVDTDRPYILAERIRKKLSILHFVNIGIQTGYGEIFIYARRG